MFYLRVVNKAEDILEVIFVEGFVAVIQIRAGLPALAFPKGVTLLIARKNQHANSIDPFRPQSIAGSLCKLLSDTLALVFGQNNSVVDVAAPAVMPGEDAADNFSANFCNKAGGGVAFQKFLNACFAVVQAAQSLGKTRHTVPQGEQCGVILGGHRAQYSFSHNLILYQSVTCQSGIEDQVDQLGVAHAVSVGFYDDI